MLWAAQQVGRDLAPRPALLHGLELPKVPHLLPRRYVDIYVDINQEGMALTNIPEWAGPKPVTVAQLRMRNDTVSVYYIQRIYGMQCSIMCGHTLCCIAHLRYM